MQCEPTEKNGGHEKKARAAFLPKPEDIALRHAGGRNPAQVWLLRA